MHFKHETNGIFYVNYVSIIIFLNPEFLFIFLTVCPQVGRIQAPDGNWPNQKLGKAILHYLEISQTL